MQEHPAGFAVWEVCPRWYARGWCAYALWCRCALSDGGPLESVVGVHESLPDALEGAEVLEAAKGGVVEVPCMVS